MIFSFHIPLKIWAASRGEISSRLAREHSKRNINLFYAHRAAHNKFTGSR